MSTPTFNFEAFEAFVSSAVQSTKDNVSLSPLVAGSKLKFHNGLATIKKSLNFSFMEEEDSAQLKSLTLDRKAKVEESLVTAVNWLVTFSKELMVKVNNHAILLAATRKVVEENKEANKEEVKQLRTKVMELEEECDEARQRGMKGNLLISSPNNRDQGSLMVQQDKKDQHGNVLRKETEVEMCVRIVHQKTGVAIPPTDISACHALNKRGPDSTYILRVTNMVPGSAWDILASCLFTGRCKKTNHVVKKEVNAFINFQVTPRRGNLLKAARLERRSNRQFKYGVDQNGRITVKVNEYCDFVAVRSEESLQELIRSPPKRQAFAQHR